MAVGGGSGGDPKRYFVGKGFVTEAQYDATRARGGDIVERLLEEGLIEERHVLGFRAQQSGIAFADLAKVQIDLVATLSLPTELARELGALPLKLDSKTLWCAMRDPWDKRALARAAEASGFHVIPVAALPEEVEARLEQL